MTEPRKFDRASASQITVFRRCPHKWYIENILGRRSPSTAKQELGTGIHSECEGYLLGGPLPVYESARRLMSSAHAPEPGGLVEWPKDYGLGLFVDTPSGRVAVRGRIDYIEPPLRLEYANIWDWKTSSNFGYCKTPEELKFDIQNIVYSQAMMQKYPDAIGTRFHHGYISTVDSNYRIVTAPKLHRTEIQELYDEYIVKAVLEMARVALLPLKDVPRNLNACGDYGGCFFREECGVIRNQTFDQLFSNNPQPEQKMSLKEKIEAAKKLVPLQMAAPTFVPNAINPPDAAKPATVVPFQPKTEAKVDYEKTVVNLLQAILDELRNGPQRAA